MDFFKDWKRPSLNNAVHTMEDAIITVSGPALAISGIIAGVDLVTGGNMLRSLPGLSMIWAICLLLTLDFQVLALGARAHRLYQSTSKSNWRKGFEIALALVVAIAISYVSIQMQSIIARSNTVTPALSIEAATLQMGINPIALIWERSSLVLVLIFLSGWFRDDAPIDRPQATAIDMQTEIDRIVAEVSERHENSILSVLKEMQIEAMQDIKTAIIEEVTQHRLLAIPKEADSKIDSNPAKVIEGKLSIDRLAIVKDALIAHPNITDPKLAEIASCSINTARKYRKIAKEA